MAAADRAAVPVRQPGLRPDRTERLWDFVYRNEIYVPKQKHRFGSYVMPVLAGERLIGRVMPRMDRKRGELVVEGVFAEEDSAGLMADAR